MKNSINNMPSQIIRRAKQTHINWENFLLREDTDKTKPEFKHVGSIEHHRKWIIKYSIVENTLEQLRTENAELKRRLAEAKEILCYHVNNRGADIREPAREFLQEAGDES